MERFGLILILALGSLSQNLYALPTEGTLSSVTKEIEIKGLKIAEKKYPIELRKTSDSTTTYPHAVVEGSYEAEPGWKLFWGRKQVALSQSGRFKLVIPIDSPKNYIYLIAQDAKESQHQEYYVSPNEWDAPPKKKEHDKRP
ncbi:MAG: hypothetical protein KA715_14680 [Xanthomonadaceae bacterium]|nr:hypothetical protein [Xanthomonadaceae bacterium]